MMLNERLAMLYAVVAQGVAFVADMQMPLGMHAGLLQLIGLFFASKFGRSRVIWVSVSLGMLLIAMGWAISHDYDRLDQTVLVDRLLSCAVLAVTGFMLADRNRAMDQVVAEAQAEKYRYIQKRAEKIGTIDSFSFRGVAMEAAWQKDEDGRALVRSDGTFYCVNDAFLQMVGLSIMPPGQTIHELVPWVKDHKQWFDECFSGQRKAPSRPVVFYCNQGNSVLLHLAVTFVSVGHECLASATIRREHGRANG